MNKIAKLTVGSIALFSLGRSLMAKYTWSKYYYAPVTLKEERIKEEDILY